MKEYIKPEVEIVTFAAEEVTSMGVTSGGGSGSFDDEE